MIRVGFLDSKSFQDREGRGAALELCHRERGDVGVIREPDRGDALVIALEEPCVRDAGPDLRVQLDRARVRGDGRLEQAAVATGGHQPGEQLRIGGLRAIDQPHHRVVRAPEIDLELREQLVREAQVRIELERSPEGRLGLHETIGVPSGRYFPIT